MPPRSAAPRVPVLAWISQHPLRVSVYLLAAGFVVLAVSSTYSLWSAWRHLRAVQALTQGSNASSGLVQRLPELRDELTAGADDLRRARDELSLFAPGFHLLDRVPGLRPVGDVPRLLDLGVALAGAGADATTALSPLGAVHPLTIPAIVHSVDANQAQLARAQGELGQASTILASIDRSAYSGRLAPVGARLDQLAHALPTAQTGLGAVTLIPSLLGAHEAATYILAGQNEEEKRATGGFMGSLGVVRVENGQVTQLDIRNSYDYSPDDRAPLPPPPPLAEWMGFGGWYIRDANWFPDFPTSAAWIEWFWQYYYGTQTDGVIAFDQEAFQQLLTVTGPIDLPDLKEHITADNYRSRMLYWLYQAYSPTSSRQFVQGAKTPFVRELGAAVFKKMLALSPDELTRFAPLALRLLDEKHVILSLRDPAATRLVASRGWDDHLDQTSPDYLYVNDSTVSYTKVAPFVKEAISESVQLGADGSVHDIVTVRYQNAYDPTVAHNTYPDWYLGEFWNPLTHKLEYKEGYYAEYLRIYVPQTASVSGLTGGDSDVTTSLETGRRVVATELQLPWGAQREVKLVFDLPSGTWSADRPYQLLVQKQPDTTSTPLTVDVTAPTGFRIDGGSGRQRHWTDPLTQDATFVATVVPQ
jgi:hypothetical protein